MGEHAQATLGLQEDERSRTTVWFTDSGCVRRLEGAREVWLAGVLLGRFADHDLAKRDLLLLTLAGESGLSLRVLGRAFGLSHEAVRQVLRKTASGGVEALVHRVRRGRPRRLSPRAERQLAKLFDQGLTPTEAHRRICKTEHVSDTTVFRAHARWKAEHPGSRVPVGATAPPKRAEEPAPVAASEATAQAGVDSGPGVEEPATASASADSSDVAPESATSGDAGRLRPLRLDRLGSSGPVQHLGGWLMLGMLHGLGWYDALEEATEAVPAARASLRASFDATALAFAIGDTTVEGTRRLRTSSATVLLRASRLPSTEQVRRTIGAFAEEHGPALHAAFGRRLVQDATASANAPDDTLVLYVDGHTRRYRGKHTLRKGWRMQDKRAVPGTSDYWVHDERGCPLWKMPSVDHQSLVQFLRPTADVARGLFGVDRRILLSFDRGGSHAEALADLRDHDIDFVTYERRPYPELLGTAFTEVVEHPGRNGRLDRLRVADAPHRNLRKGRGRVRRIAVMDEDGKQFCLLTNSALPAKTIVLVHLARWGNQENQFKHGAQRWGINQLDSREVTPFPPDTIIPNPARRRLDRMLRDARAGEGMLLRQRDAAVSDEARQEFERALACNRENQQKLVALRPSVPTRIALGDSELAGKLVHHTQRHKGVLDTLRIALANAESELAATLAPFLRRPQEAKRLLRTVFAAPGTFRVRSRAVTVTLDPAATPGERRALDQAFRALDQQGSLRVPDASGALPIRFRVKEL